MRLEYRTQLYSYVLFNNKSYDLEQILNYFEWFVLALLFTCTLIATSYMQPVTVLQMYVTYIQCEVHHKQLRIDYNMQIRIAITPPKQISKHAAARQLATQCTKLVNVKVISEQLATYILQAMSIGPATGRHFF